MKESYTNQPLSKNTFTMPETPPLSYSRILSSSASLALGKQPYSNICNLYSSDPEYTDYTWRYTGSRIPIVFAFASRRNSWTSSVKYTKVSREPIQEASLVQSKEKRKLALYLNI